MSTPLSDRAAATLRRVYETLVERGCKPEWTADGRGIVATCPCCGGERGLVVEFPAIDQGAA